MKTIYLIQPAGSEVWIQTPARTVKELRNAGHTVTLDKRESEKTRTVFIEIQPA